MYASIDCLLNKYVQWGFALTQTSLIVELQVLDKIRFF